jgi:LacI family transcriptional regulator
LAEFTQRDLARRLGLSYATVSRVFNEDPRVRPETRRRVLQEAADLGFRGNALARALRLKKSFSIGMIGVNTGFGYFATVAAALEQRARESGYHVIICHRDPAGGSAREVEFLLDRQVDALVLTPDPHHEDRDQLAAVAESGRPLVLVDRFLPDFPCHYLGTASRAGSRALAEYLLALGHRRIAYVSGPEGDSTAEARLAGYREAMDACGLEPLVVPAGGWSQADGEKVLPQLALLAPRATAVMACNDPVAVGLFLGLRRAGVRIPAELSLAGYADEPTGECLATPLTTVHQPAARLGLRTAEVVLSLLEGPPPGDFVHEELEDTLVLRASCAPPA